jgi:enoyl-CoA hydratase/carnithine racemase
VTGIGTALRLLLVGEVLPASEAVSLGLLNRVAAGDRLSEVVDEIVGALRASAPLALAYAKELVHTGSDVALATGLRLETDLSVLLQTTQDRREGIRAFLERRPAQFGGC